jgi:hypothetical protein
MTEGFRSPPTPAGTGGWGDTTESRQQEVTDTVQRIMGEGIAPAPRPATPQPMDRPGDSSTADVAKDQAALITDTTKQAGAQVADTVRDQAGHVAEETKHQAKQLLSQAQTELSDQAAVTQQRVSEGLHALADELTGMAKNSEQDGPATDLARQAADKAREAAGWLGDRDPGSLLDEVRSFARRKPGTYLALALGAGVLAGRLTRGLTASSATTAAGARPPGTRQQTANYRVSTGQSVLPGTDLHDGTPLYDPVPVTTAVPVIPAPIVGVGDSDALSGRRGDLAP